MKAKRSWNAIGFISLRSRVLFGKLGLFGWVLCGCVLLTLGYVLHRALSLQANHVRLIESRISHIPRECAKPNYELLLSTASTASSTVMDPHKICITTLTDAKKADPWQRWLRWRNFEGLLDITWPNKQAYAEKHGYQLFDESDSLDVRRPPSWSKIRAVQRLLTQEDCEWVVWWDADTIVMNSNKRIQEFLPAQLDLLLTEQKGGSYNAGAWVMKRTNWSLAFLEHWWNMKEFVQHKGLSTSGDNDALKHYLTKTMANKEFQQHIGVPPRCTFNSVTVFLTPKQFQEEMNKPPEQLQWYMHHEKYHKGDLIAHIAGKDNKIDTTKMMLQYAV